MENQRYDIVAKVPRDTDAGGFRLMIRHLLVERLQLVAHTESRQQPVFELTVAKNGFKLKDAEPLPSTQGNDVPFLIRDAEGRPQLPPGRRKTYHLMMTPGVEIFMGRMQSIEDLIDTFSAAARHPIIDRTGLQGRYDYWFEHALQSYSVRAATQRDSGDDRGHPGTETGPEPSRTLIEDVQLQFGLKLLPKTSAVDVLVVDAFNRTPVDN
jgi:uncharacterized protein (TIGR03435 family)